ncbi:JAB domain-containing protein [Bergeyella zoohelcum]|uniref:DNA repair protein RadC n=1 Tax=Bergeyella zoohelcum ATCC 43767 TaxID=883096 RepID=K1LWY4_9FLAO|nr:JAB domain-containing protein [Bergeyella zoohelcum]EKB56617.1 DNA repair protein RadC [Bergeyella zoohelcum ATCC 43767]SUV48475.1 DNA repair protein RadC [Bergeyella zoohelcum]
MTYLQEIKIHLDKTTESSFKYGITNDEDAIKAFRNIYEDLEIYESFYALYLNNSNEIIGWRKISQGGITSTVVDVRLIFAPAFQCLATAIIVCHNHPSGKLEPSREDILLTKKIKDIGELMNIKLLDHIILTLDDYYSFADNGQI